MAGSSSTMAINGHMKVSPLQTGRFTIASQKSASLSNTIAEVATKIIWKRKKRASSSSFFLMDRRRRLQIYQQHGQIGRANAADAARLAQAGGANPAQLLARLETQLRHGSIVEAGRNRLRFLPLKA